MYRLPKHQNRYKKERQTVTECPFCPPNKKLMVEELKFFYVIKNMYPYSLWDFRQVNKHYMLVPKEHIEGFVDFKQGWQEEYCQIVTRYSENGFNVYTRATGSVMRSQPHFHTHFIKTKGKIVREVFYKDDPYTLEYK